MEAQMTRDQQFEENRRARPSSATTQTGVEDALPSSIYFGPFKLDPHERRLTRGREVIRVGSRALDILVTLIESEGKVVSKRTLLERAWPDLFVDDGTLRVHIAALRKALGDGRDGARYIASVTGRGYSFVARTLRGTLRPSHKIMDVLQRDADDPVATLPFQTSDMMQQELVRALRTSSRHEGAEFEVVDLAHCRVLIVRMYRAPNPVFENPE